MSYPSYSGNNVTFAETGSAGSSITFDYTSFEGDLLLNQIRYNGFYQLTTNMCEYSETTITHDNGILEMATTFNQNGGDFIGVAIARVDVSGFIV